MLLRTDYATKMEQARVALKDVRNFEAKLQPQRDLRLDTKNRISKLTEKKAEESKITAAEHGACKSCAIKHSNIHH